MIEPGTLYNAIATEFDRDRNKSLMEGDYLRAVLSKVRRHAEILDLGCGTAEPVARFFIESGCRVTGVDVAPAMIAMARERFPATTWLERDMRSLDLGRSFDAIVAWDSFFHLTADHQRRMFPVFERHVAPRGLLLFTSGPKAGMAIGTVYGRELFHASLDVAEYERLLSAHRFEVLLHRVQDPKCGDHTVWLAQHDAST